MRPGHAAAHPGALRALARPPTHSHQLTAAPGREGLTYESYSSRRHLASVAAAARATSPSSFRSLAQSGRRTRNSRDRLFPSYVDGDGDVFPGRSRRLTPPSRTERGGQGRAGAGRGRVWRPGEACGARPVAVFNQFRQPILPAPLFQLSPLAESSGKERPIPSRVRALTAETRDKRTAASSLRCPSLKSGVRICLETQSLS